MDFLGDYLKSAKPSDMDDTEQEAKMRVIKELLGLADNHMGEDLKGMKSVTVAAPDKAGVELGLSKAKDIMNKGTDMTAEGGDPTQPDADAVSAAKDVFSQKGPAKTAEDNTGVEEKEDGGKDSDDGLGDMSPEEIDALMEMLNQKRSKMTSGGKIDS